ncbi:MAG: DinB family protein [Deltaproteobacteria bacterium]|nr:DinB family protein [Deltaproteobacteria bacterium]
MESVDLIRKITAKSLKEFLLYLRKTDQAKLNWKPLKNGRSVIQITQEVLAVCELLVKGFQSNFKDFNVEVYNKLLKDFSAVKELDQLVSQLQKSTKKLLSLIQPLGDLSKKIKTPFGTMTLLELACLHANHMHYHLGQIAYIQTLYGDTIIYE